MRSSRSLDIIGAVTVTASLMLAVYGINGHPGGWRSATTIGLLIGAVVLFATFAAWEMRAEAPLMPLRLFLHRNLSTANGVGILWAGAMFSWFFISSQYLQFVLGYKPLKVGLAFLPGNLIMGALSIGISAKLVIKYGYRKPLAAGLLLAAIGLATPGACACARPLPAECPAEHDPARFGAGIRLQPGATRGDG